MVDVVTPKGLGARHKEYGMPRSDESGPLPNFRELFQQAKNGFQIFQHPSDSCHFF
jgi:hypothetical protein